MHDDATTALVLFSGGQDSTTCLAWALEHFLHVETISFDYGQRHLVELDVRPRIFERIRREFPQWRDRLGKDRIVDLSVLNTINETALTHQIEIGLQTNGIPNTFVPGRNLFFLVLAAAVAYRGGAKHLIAGVCETDYSGYPDCRDDTIKAMQLVLNLGMDSRFVIHTPLMRTTKAQTWALAERLGGETLVDLICEESHTCYNGDREHRHDWGFGCGSCQACVLRAQGWTSFRSSKVSDVVYHETN